MLKTKHQTILKRASFAGLVLISWVGVAILLASSERPAQDSSAQRVTAAVPLPVGVYAPDSPLNYAVQPLTISSPDLNVEQQFTTDLGGARVKLSKPEFEGVQPYVEALGLFDFRYKPAIKLDDLK